MAFLSGVHFSYRVRVLEHAERDAAGSLWSACGWVVAGVRYGARFSDMILHLEDGI
jgi:hypothetical protein